MIKVTFTVKEDNGYVVTEGFTTSFPITVDGDKNINEDVFDVGGSVALAQIKLKAQKGNDALDGITWSFDKDTVDFVTNKTAKLTITAKSGRKFEVAPTVAGLNNGTLSSDKTKATYDITVNETPTSVETTNNYVITGGKYETLTTIKVDDSGLVGADVTLSKKEGITPEDQVTITVTPKTGYKFENVPTVEGVEGVTLGEVGGKYVGTIPKGKFTSDDITLKITGNGKFTSESKEEKTNDKGVKQTVNKKVESTAKATTSPEGVYDAVKASGHISSELNTLANATEQRALNISATIEPQADVDNPIKTKIQDDKLNLGYAFVIAITKNMDGGNNIPLTDLGNNLITFTISVPEEQRGKKDYAVYRMHDGLAEVITTTPNAYGEYIEVSADTSTITLHASKFSTFAIAYGDDAEVVPDTPAPEPNPGEDNPAKEDDNNKGTITPSNGTTATTNTAKAATSTKAAKATTSTKKSSKTSSPKTADYAVNSLLALLTGAAGLFGITLINKKRKEDEE